MDLPVTAALAAGFLALAVFCGWRGSRPPDFRRGPRMMPWGTLMVASVAGALLMLVHLANLMGIKTGR